MRRAKSKEETLCDQILHAMRKEKIAKDILKERLCSILGHVFMGFNVFDDSPEYMRCLWVTGCPNKMYLLPEMQDEIYKMGFLRVEIVHDDESRTYFYKGGDPRGYHTKT